MKKSLSIVLFLLTISVFSQQTETYNKTNEIKINAFNVLIFKTIDVSYEYLLNEESSVGVSLLFNLNDYNTDGPYYNEVFALTPYYRWFFSKKYAQGFFVEGFGMYNIQKEEIYYYDDTCFNCGGSLEASNENKSNNLALGISLGAKFSSKKGYLFEFYAGIGRNMFSSNKDYNYEFVPRLGISLGYRF